MATLYARIEGPNGPDTIPVTVGDTQPATLPQVASQLTSQGYKVAGFIDASQGLSPDIATQVQNKPPINLTGEAWRNIPSTQQQENVKGFLPPPPQSGPPQPGMSLSSLIPPALATAVTMRAPLPIRVGAGLAAAVVGHLYQKLFQPEVPNVTLPQRLGSELIGQATGEIGGPLIARGLSKAAKPVEEYSAGLATRLENLPQVGPRPMPPVKSAATPIAETVATPQQPIRPLSPSPQARVGYNQRVRTFEEASTRAGAKNLAAEKAAQGEANLTADQYAEAQRVYQDALAQHKTQEQALAEARKSIVKSAEGVGTLVGGVGGVGTGAALGTSAQSFAPSVGLGGLGSAGSMGILGGIGAKYGGQIGRDVGEAMTLAPARYAARLNNISRIANLIPAWADNYLPLLMSQTARVETSPRPQRGPRPLGAVPNY